MNSWLNQLEAMDFGSSHLSSTLYLHFVFVLQGANVQNAQLRIFPMLWNIDAAERLLK